jgi:hypothetical protein
MSKYKKASLLSPLLVFSLLYPAQNYSYAASTLMNSDYISNGYIPLSINQHAGFVPVQFAKSYKIKSNVAWNTPDLTNISVGKPTIIAGQVLDSNNQPLPKHTLEVTISGKTKIVKTDHLGIFNLVVVPTANDKNVLTVYATGSSIDTAPLHIPVSSGNGTVSTILNTPSKSNTTTTLSGKLVTATGKPAGHIMFTIANSNGNVINVQTGNNGEFAAVFPNSQVNTDTTFTLAGTAVKPVTTTVTSQPAVVWNEPITNNVTTTISGKLVNQNQHRFYYQQSRNCHKC